MVSVNYPIEKLQKIKREHEAWVSSRLELDIDKQKDEESYAEIVDEWEKKVFYQGLAKLDRRNLICWSTANE